MQHERRLVVAAQRLGAGEPSQLARAWPLSSRSALSCASSSAQPRFTRTQTSRNTWPPNRRSMSVRALRRDLLHPRAALAQQDRALVRRGPRRPWRGCGAASPSCSKWSIATVVAYGTSSPSRRKIFSRTNSAARKRSSRSVISSAPIERRRPRGSSARISASSASSARALFRADTGTIAANGKQRGELGHLRQQRVLVLERDRPC